MAKLKGIDKLIESIEILKSIAKDIRLNLDDKAAWLDDKSEKFQEGDEGQEWITHLQDVESVLEAIDRFRIP